MRSLLCWWVIAAAASCSTAPVNAGLRTRSEARAKPGLIEIPVREDGIVGTLIVPDSTKRYPGVLRIGGAEGGISTGDAEVIASDGYAVLAIAYFGAERLPGDLEEVPVEYFGKVLDWMHKSPRIDASHLAIVGISRGSTLALLLPTIYKDFDAIVAIAPTHVVWQSAYLDWDRYAVRSSLTLHGEPLPFVPYDFSDEASSASCNKQGACAAMYDFSLKQEAAVNAALIPVEQLRAPVLLISGASDSMWPSSRMSALVMQRLAKAGFPYEYRHVDYGDAGHCGILKCYGGGTAEGNQRARADLREQIRSFLNRHLRPRSPRG